MVRSGAVTFGEGLLARGSGFNGEWGDLCPFDVVF
jgi:hypothetical protein